MSGLDFLPSRRIALYLTRLFLTRTLAVLVLLVLVLMSLDLLEQAFAGALATASLKRDKEQAEADLLAANQRLEALLREVNHRVANSLQLVTTMVAMQARLLSDDAAKTALSDTERRIQAIAQVHRKLYTSGDVESVAMNEYLAERLVVCLFLQPRQLGRGLLDELPATLVLVHGTQFRHDLSSPTAAYAASFSCSAGNGKLNRRSSSRASSSVLAVVVTITSMPRTLSIWS